MADIKIATNPDQVVTLQGGQRAKKKPRTQQDAARAHQENKKSDFMRRMNLASREKAGPPAPMPEAAPQDMAQGQPPAPGFSFGSAAQGAFEKGLDQERMVDEARYSYLKGNQLYDDNQRLVQEQTRVNEKTAGLQRDVYDAELAKAKAQADGMEYVAETQMDLADRAMAREAREVRRNDQIRERVQQYDQQISESVDAMRRAQEVDPTAGFENRSAWQKIRTVLASAFRGAAGRDPMAYVNRAISTEMEAQKMKFGQAQATASAAMGAMRTGGMGLMESFRAMGADERAADAATRVALLEAVKSKHLANVEQYGTVETQARQDALMNQLNGQIAQERMRLARAEASEPKYFVKSGSTMGKAEQAYRKAMGGEMIKSVGEAIKQGLGVERDAAKVRTEMQAEQVAAGVQNPEGLTKDDMAAIRAYSNDEKTGSLEGVVRQIDRMLAKEDIPGVGKYTTDMMGSDSRDYEQAIRVLKEAIGRAQSGGAIGDDEKEEFLALLESGVARGGGEERLRKNLAQVKSLFNDRLETRRRGLTRAQRAYITRADNPDFAAEYQQPGAAHRSEFE